MYHERLQLAKQPEEFFRQDSGVSDAIEFDQAIQNS